MFLDRVEVHIQAGAGGPGAVSFRREKFIPMGGPDGGDGGRGGSVVAVAQPSLNSLADYRYRHHFKAQPGLNGEGNQRHGKKGEDLLLPVPPGTVVRELGTGRVLADLTEPGQRAVICQGGRGGRGNARFKGPTQQAPRIAERGEPGEHGSFVFELRMLADVGLVGLPNAGKSSLLAALTRATPKVADYPFTTLQPELGMLDEGSGQALLADLPGLIEGAAEGRGLGHDFLRHVARTRLLLQVVDAGGGDAEGARLAIEQVEAELVAFDAELALRPRLVFFNKLDLTGSDAVVAELGPALVERGLEVLSGSAASGEGLDALKARLIRRLAELPPPPPLAVESRPKVLATAFVVRRDEGGVRVVGETVERRVAMTDMLNPEAVQRLSNYLRRKGVERALTALGVARGTEVQVGDVTLVWRPDLVIPRRRAGKAAPPNEEAAP